MASKSIDAQTLDKEQAVKLYEGIRAVESIAADIKDLQADMNERKTLITETLPIQKDVLDFVLKRRKHSKGILNNFDTMLQLVEEAIAEVESEHAEEVRGKISAAARRGGGQPTLLEDDDADEEQERERAY